MRYFIINKPFGTLSQFTREQASHRVLSDHFDFPKEVYPVGRLDRDSEGLLLLTDDKKVNAALLDPKNKQPKEYWVQVEGRPTDAALQLLRTGVSIKVKKSVHACLPAEVDPIDEPEGLWERNPPVRFRKNIPTSWCRIILQEGKNRQVRKMFAKVGFPVLRLIRAKLGALSITGISSGAVKEIEQTDLGL